MSLVTGANAAVAAKQATSVVPIVFLLMGETLGTALVAGGGSTEAWCTVLDDLIKRGLRRPEFLSYHDLLGFGRYNNGADCRVGPAQRDLANPWLS
jgi:hypothetical protein